MNPMNVSVEPARLTLGTWLGFLFGSRQAILAVAGSRAALWVGLLFVLSAGLAREYDGAYLLREPWHLLLPLAASLATACALFLLIYLSSGRHSIKELRWWTGYRTMLTFFWMTAPLAWLYAIPVERLLDPGPATEVNLWLLGVVSVWRVLLVTRVLAVWLGAHFLWEMIWIVLFFADTVALLLVTVTPTPIWNIMGGIRLPERESVIVGAKLMVWFFGTIGWFVFAIAANYVMFYRTERWSLSASPDQRAGASLWLFAGLLLAVGCGLLPLLQGEQRRAWEVTQLLRSGQIAEAAEQMSQVTRESFPPHWDPPPRTAYGEKVPDSLAILTAMHEADTSPKMRTVFVEKLLSEYDGISRAVASATAEDARVLEEVLDFLARRPPGGEYRYSVERQLREAVENLERAPEVREMILKYLNWHVKEPAEEAM